MITKYIVRIEENAKRAIAMEYIRIERMRRKRLKWI